MKKLINQPENFVKESLMGMARAHSGLIKVNFDPTFVYRAETPDKSKVAIISGGGSGHEPMHTGFVGKGMLDAACPGEIFTSPTPDQMLAAAEKVDSGLGTLYIVKNYSGDIMNFEMATELARSQGIRTLNMIIDDDVAVKNSSYTQGRRGVGTTILAEKNLWSSCRARLRFTSGCQFVQKSKSSGKKYRSGFEFLYSTR